MRRAAAQFWLGGREFHFSFIYLFPGRVHLAGDRTRPIFFCARLHSLACSWRGLVRVPAKGCSLVGPRLPAVKLFAACPGCARMFEGPLTYDSNLGIIVMVSIMASPVQLFHTRRRPWHVAGGTAQESWGEIVKPEGQVSAAAGTVRPRECQFLR